MNLENFTNIPLGQRVTLGILVLAILIGGFAYGIYSPKIREIEQLKTDMLQRTEEIRRNEIKEEKLDDLKDEYVFLEDLLEQRLKQLPSEAEVPGLLKQVSELGTQVGLEIKLWKPARKNTLPSGLYTEVPVQVEISGGYHSVALFFDKISRLQRIINVHDIEMNHAKIDQDQVRIQTSFMAVAFALPDGS